MIININNIFINITYIMINIIYVNIIMINIFNITHKHKFIGIIHRDRSVDIIYNLCQ